MRKNPFRPALRYEVFFDNGMKVKSGHGMFYELERGQYEAQNALLSGMKMFKATGGYYRLISVTRDRGQDIGLFERMRYVPKAERKNTSFFVDDRAAEAELITAADTKLKIKVVSTTNEDGSFTLTATNVDGVVATLKTQFQKKKCLTRDRLVKIIEHRTSHPILTILNVVSETYVAEYYTVNFRAVMLVRALKEAKGYPAALCSAPCEDIDMPSANSEVWNSGIVKSFAKVEEYKDYFVGWVA